MKELHIKLSIYHELDEVSTEAYILAYIESVLEGTGLKYQINGIEEQEVYWPH